MPVYGAEREKQPYGTDLHDVVKARLAEIVASVREAKPKSHTEIYDILERTSMAWSGIGHTPFITTEHAIDSEDQFYEKLLEGFPITSDLAVGALAPERVNELIDYDHAIQCAECLRGGKLALGLPDGHPIVDHLLQWGVPGPTELFRVWRATEVELNQRRFDYFADHAMSVLPSAEFGVLGEGRIESGEKVCEYVLDIVKIMPVEDGENSQD